MRKIILSVIIIISLQIRGQGLEFMQNIIPQTPETNAILKVFETPVSLYTGSPDISIPIYNIKEGDINYNIKLSYNSTGITVGERASWVGLGWNLPTPTLVRNVRQIPDDFSYGFFYETKYTVNNVYNITKNSTANTSPVNDNCLQCSEIDNLYKSKLLDLESDDYRLTLPDGKSISFMVNQERDTQHPFGHIVQFPQSDYKIEYFSSGNWEIMSPQGYKYLYVRGNMINSSYIFTIGGTSLGTLPQNKSQPYNSTWVLSKITSPTNHILNFEYDPVIYEDCDLVNQTKTVDLFSETPSLTDARNMVYTNYSKTRGTNFYISRIWGDFGEVIFNKDSRLDYTTYGRKLNNIEIKNKSGLVDKVSLDFDYMTSLSPGSIYTCNRMENDNDVSKRLILKKVNLNANTSQPISYQFNYNNTALPDRLSYSRDWWGYYNGESNTGLTPSIDLEITEKNKRNVNPEFAKAGILEEIVYPTGGRTKFQFESNRGIFYDYNSVDMQKIHDIIPSKIKNYLFSTRSDDTQLLNKVYEDQIFFDANDLTSSAFQTIELKTTTTKCIYPEDSLPYINSCSIYYSILDNSNNIIVGRSLLLNGYSRTLQIPKNQLLNGLKVKMEVFAGRVRRETQYFNYPDDEGAINLSHRVIDTTLVKNTPYGMEVPLGGLRIKRIENYENKQIPIIKEYDYKINGIETGLSLFELDFFQTIPGKSFVVSQSRFPMQTGNGSLIAYTNVKEYRINPITNEKNNITNIFQNNYILGSYIGSCFLNSGIGDGLLSASVPCFEDPRNGKPLVINYSNKKSESFDYQNVSLIGKNLSWVDGMDYDRVIKLTDFKYIGTGVANPVFLGADFFYYKFKNFDDPDYSKETKDFFNGNEVKTQIQYSSLNPNHHQITKQTTTQADNTVTETTYSYAHEKGNQLMIDKNMIGIPLETITTQTRGNSTKTLSRIETVYPVSVPTTQAGSLLLPLSVRSYDLQNPTTFYTEVTYNQYDSKGNLQQYTTKDGVPVAIIWGYNQTQPIAKIEGATYAQVSSLASAIITASNTDASASVNNDESALLTALDSFRNNSALSGYQVSTYTYDPLIGVRSITPSSGIRESYIYDSGNRLEKVIDINGNILKEYKYNYKQ